MRQGSPAYIVLSRFERELRRWRKLEDCLNKSDVKSFLEALPFIKEYAISLVSFFPGKVTIELPFDERFSGPKTLFPASIVGTSGDVAAVSSCLSLLPKGWALASLDFTVKMTGVAKGEKLKAKGRVLGRVIPIQSEPLTYTS